VFRVIPSWPGTFENKLGISSDSVKTGPFAVGLNLNFDMSPAEIRKMQANTEESYAVFLQRVADGRDMSVEEVKKVAQGRVWTGLQALDNGLVDELGDYDAALAAAAELADLEEYRVVNYPKVKDPLQQLLEDLMNSGGEEARLGRAIQKEFPQLAPHYQLLKEMHTQSGIQARSTVVVPFE
jgi:protease-4